MSGGYCSYVDAECEWYNNSVKCAKIPAVQCRNYRERVIKEKEAANETEVARDCTSRDRG